MIKYILQKSTDLSISFCRPCPSSWNPFMCTDSVLENSFMMTVLSDLYKTNILLIYSLFLSPCSLHLFLVIPPNSTTSPLPTATVPASPSSSQCTQPAVPCRHPCHGWRSSMDGPGELGSGRPWDVGSVAEGERQAVPGLGADSIWGNSQILLML